MRTQCKLLGVSRSSLSYKPAAPKPQQQRLCRILDELYLRDPCLGTRRLVSVLQREHGITINRKKLQRVRRQMGVEAIYCKPRTSIPEKGHRIYPYLLRDRGVTRPDEVWCADICFAPPHGAHRFAAACGWLPRPSVPTSPCHAVTPTCAPSWTGTRAACWAMP